MPIPFDFKPAVNPPIGGVGGQGKDAKLSKAADSSKPPESPFDFNQMMGLMMMNMMNQGGQGVAGAPMAPAGGAAPAMNPNLGALLQHFGSGATRRTMGGQVEGTPAPDPFTNLNAQRDSQQAHEMSKANFAIQRAEAREQLGIPPGGYDFGQANRTAMVEGARQRQQDDAAYAGSEQAQQVAAARRGTVYDATGAALGNPLGPQGDPFDVGFSLTEAGQAAMPQDPFYGMSPGQQEATQAIGGEFDYASPVGGGYGSEGVGKRHPFIQGLADEGTSARQSALMDVFRGWQAGKKPPINPNQPAATGKGSYFW